MEYEKEQNQESISNVFFKKKEENNNKLILLNIILGSLSSILIIAISIYIH